MSYDSFDKAPSLNNGPEPLYDHVSQIPKMSLTFFISEGILSISNAPSGSYEIKATSGRGSSMNNPNATHLVNEGPIPAGIYCMKPSELDDPSYAYDYWIRNAANLGYSDWGDWRIRLHPEEVENNNRTNLFIHGGQKPGTKGCIDIGGGIHGNELTDRLKKDIANSHQQKINVTVIR